MPTGRVSVLIGGKEYLHPATKEVPPDSLAIWTVYQRPRDYPDGFVVRRQWATREGEVLIDVEARYAPTLEDARALIPPDLHRLGRQPIDDPVIVETWI